MFIGTRRTLRRIAAVAPVLTLVFAAGPEAARAQQTATGLKVAGISVSAGAVRRPEMGAGAGKLVASVARELGLPAAPAANAEVLVWAGLKPGRPKFVRAAVENALREGGYAVAAVSEYALRETNPFDEQYGLMSGAIDLGVTDRVSYFTAKNESKRQTLVGAWVEGETRLALALAPAGHRAEEKKAPLPDVAGPNTLLVKDNNDAMRGIAPPKAPAFPALAKKPRTLRGAVRDAAGKPIAGAQIIVQASAAGGFRTDVRARTNAQGIYEMPLPVGICQVVNADCTVRYNGKSYLLPLHPVDGQRDHFDSKGGHIENFTLRTYGAASEETARSPQFGSYYYGGHIRLVWFDSDIPVGSGVIEITLTPQGPLMGGVPARTLVFRLPNNKPQSEAYLNDIPIGKYKMTVRLRDGAESLPVRVMPVFGYDGEPVASLTVEFEPNEGSLASLGQSGVKRFDVMMKP
jgi:hypothetical protein